MNCFKKHFMVNFARYDQQTKDAPSMDTTFKLDNLTGKQVFLLLEIRGGNPTKQCFISVTLNDYVLLEGQDKFSDIGWQCCSIPIPTGVLKTGDNRLAICNRELQGDLGRCTVARVVIVGEEFHKLEIASTEEMLVDIPKGIRPLPEPLPSGTLAPGFKFRGIKGYNWSVEQYMEEIPVLAKYKMNFLMNCYLSLFDGGKNEWYKPMPDEKKRAYANLFRACRNNDIIFCFSVHPQFKSAHPLDLTNAADIERYYQHFHWAQEQGVRWFSISLDDVSWGERGPIVSAHEHANLVNMFLSRLRSKDPNTQMIFCPIPYHGDGANGDCRVYLETIANEMNQDVYVFWTGNKIVSHRITRKAAENYKCIVKHRLFIWDNYPANDAHPTLHLGPVCGRDADLCDVADGYISNPLCQQNQINRIPLLTCADYAYNPKGYDPERSIGQAILHLTDTDAQRLVLKELVEIYPGLLVWGGYIDSNPVREQFRWLISLHEPTSCMEEYIKRIEGICLRLNREFPDSFTATRNTVASDIAWLKETLDMQR